MLLFHFILLSALLVLLILIIFFATSKMEKFESLSFSTFECGFTSYFFSRVSFSIHFFIIGLIFLFLDLEICLLMPLMMEFFDNLISLSLMLIFIFLLLLSVIVEWLDGNIEWKH